METEFGSDVLANRQIKRLYYVLAQVVDADNFMEADDIETNAQRMHRVFLASARIYLMHDFTVEDLLADFDQLFNKLIEASLADEYYEKTSNLTKVQARLTELCNIKAIPALPLREHAVLD